MKRLVFDRQTAYLGTLFAVIIASAAWLMHRATLTTIPARTSLPGDVSGSAATTGAGWAIAEVAFALALLAFILGFRKAPGWLRTLTKFNVVILALMLLGYARIPAVFVMAAVSLVYVTEHYDVFWVVNNAASVALAVVGAVGIGLLFDPLPIFVALLGLMVYDHVFANRRDEMFTLAEFVINLRLPVVFVKPATSRVDLQGLITDGDDEQPDHAWAIGTADLMLPAGFVASLVRIYGLAGLGAVVVVLVSLSIVASSSRIRHLMLSKGSGAGLPPITASIALVYVPVLFAGV